MTRTRIVAAALGLAVLAACDGGPTAVKAPPAAPRRDLTNQPPVAVITYTRHVIVGGMRYYLNSSGSYDPDGTITSRFWANNCYPQPESNQVTTTIDTSPDAPCDVTLEVWDDQGAIGTQEVHLN
jgi:hypothetical protein